MSNGGYTVDRTPSQVVLDERRGFQRSESGAIVIRRWFGADAVATAIALLGPIVYLAIVALLLALLLGVLPDGANS
jgi:hypothetical protein